MYMTSQLVKVPVVLKKECSDRQSLESFGTVTETEEGWVVDYTARVGYFLDDESFIYDFCTSASRFGITIEDVIEFNWGNAEKLKLTLP